MAQTIDLTDFGFKDISTTGSMAAGSNQLTIAAGAGFRVGDSVIVEIGGEAGHGLRGTMGVGGVDPAADQSYYKGGRAQGSDGKDRRHQRRWHGVDARPFGSDGDDW